MSQEAETLKDRLIRINADLDNINKYYDYGRKLYEYRDIRPPLTSNENKNRQGLTLYENSFDNSAGNGKFLFGLLGPMLFAKLRRLPVLDSTSYTKNIGLTLAIYLGTAYFYMQMSRPIPTSAVVRDNMLMQRIAENERVHGLIKTTRFDLDTRMLGAFEDTN